MQQPDSNTSSADNSQQIRHGFQCIEQRFVPEVNAHCLHFRHLKSGARLLKIAANDPNKLFNIAFKTLPDNDTGIPHILEHSVLNGSKSFPVKSPFDILLKGSLHTFLNAMTSAEHTTYPVASMNEKDYFNLMHVYLDAVFNPLMLEDERILKQEGWHFELTHQDAPLVYRGVVYNEMKGTYSSPMYQLYDLMGRHLFPDNTYGVSSGGHPDAIPQLTQEAFAAFHQKYYHPDNSYILLYGDADLDRELKFIDEYFLNHYTATQQLYEIPLQKPFEQPKTVVEHYPVTESGSEEEGTYLTLSFVTNLSSDRTTSMAFDLLTHTLITHESAPLRIAMQEAGIGKEVMGWFVEAMQNSLHIVVTHAEAADLERFREVVYAILRKCAAEGFDQATIEGLVNRMEFTLREGDTPQRGLMYLDMLMHGWLFEENPFAGMEYEKHLAELKEKLNHRYLEELVQSHLIDNPHALLLALVPESGLQARLDKQTESKLADIKATLSDAQQAALIAETEQLIEYQQTGDSPEALASIPMLTIADIGTDALFYPLEKESLPGGILLHNPQFTNGVVYTSLHFDLRALPSELLPYAALLSALLGKTSTRNHTFGALDDALNIYTGGFSVSLATYCENRSDEQLLPKMIVSAKAVEGKTGKMFELLAEILTESDFTNRARLHSLLKRIHAQLDTNIRQNGMNYAITRNASGHSYRGWFNELTGGYTYHAFITELLKNFDQQFEQLTHRLAETGRLLFAGNHLSPLVTCSREFFGNVHPEVAILMARLPLSPASYQLQLSLNEPLNEAICATSQVQYVAKGYNFKKLGYTWSGKIALLSQIISTEWLHNQIRVIGGAYGGFCGFSGSGNAYFASYRDPNLTETLDRFDAIPGFLEKFAADEQAMTRFIIGTIASLDQPKTASQKGVAAMTYHLENITSEMLNSERAEILSATAADIRQLAGLTSDILASNRYCIYGNETLLQQNASLFDRLLTITE